MTNKMFFKQQPCLDQRLVSEDQICFCTFVEGRRMYGSVPDPDCYARFLLSEEAGANFSNELLWSDTHTYVDLDAPCTLEELGCTLEGFMEAFNELLIDQFAKHLGVAIRVSDILWSNGTRPGKTSFHIKISCDHYWPAADRPKMKDFFRLVNQQCLVTNGFHFYTTVDDRLQLNSILDLSVYSANRCFRSLGCRKPDSTVLAPISGAVTHSAIIAHMISISCREGLTPFVLKSKCKIPIVNTSIETSALGELAAKFGAKYIETKGSLCILRNDGCRICPINNESNTSDNPYFVLKDKGSTVWFGCHNESCQGQLIQVHTFQGQKLYTYYEDYKLLLNKPDVSVADVAEYLKSTISYIDKPEQPFFVTLRKVGVPCFSNKIDYSEVSCAKALFQRTADIHLVPENAEPDDKPIKFCSVLNSLLKQRRIPTYANVVWRPYLKRGPSDPRELNTFQGFCLSTVKKSNLDFTKTLVYDLLCRLCNHKQEYITYLCSFIGQKLQCPATKHPIALCFLKSKEGSGKGSFSLFLEKLFSCGSSSHISFNNLQSFASSFNAIQAKALWIVLEEISAKRNCLKEYSGFLKAKISDNTLLCEPKGKERSLVPWFSNLILFSNDFNVLSCSKNDRRLVMFTSDSSKANCKEYFTQIYAELADLKVMRAAFDFFADLDVTEFNYRAIPYSRLKEKLSHVTEKHVTKFHRWLLKNQFCHQASYVFNEADVYSYYKNFCEEYGVNKQADRHYVCTQLELYLNMSKRGEEYGLSQIERNRYYKEIKR
jgi:hypothetical protein